jgi:hypothetical protein
MAAGEQGVADEQLSDKAAPLRCKGVATPEGVGERRKHDDMIRAAVRKRVRATLDKSD